MLNRLQSLSLLSAGILSASVSAAVPASPADENRSQSMSTLLTESLNSVFNEQAQERYIVEFHDTEQFTKGQSKKFDEQAARAAIASAKGQAIKVLHQQKMVVAKLNEKGLSELKKHKDVKRVSVDQKRKLMAQTTPYGFNMVEANLLVQNDTTARKVCVIDTGINRGHSDLPDANSGLTGNSNNSQVGDWYNDGHGHGTHVAGTISAQDNSYGIVGVYPGVNLHVVKIFNDSGSWTYASDLISAVEQCQSAGANVVNMSLGGSYSSAAERDAMQAFENNGLLLVAAAGNAGNNTKSYPASYDAVVSVAAVQSNGSRASYSQYNDQVEIAAPGSSVLSTYPVDRYATMNGTSMAAPHVSGAAALLWSFYPQCTNAEIRQALTATAEDKGTAGRDNYYGFGIVKAKQAHDYLANNGCAADAPTDPGEPGTGVTETYENISLDSRGWVKMSFDVPAGTPRITFRTEGGTGDLSLYVRSGRSPTLSVYDCRSLNKGNTEECVIESPVEGQWWVGLRGDEAFSGVTLTYSTDAGGTEEPVTEPVEPVTGETETYENLSLDSRGWERMSWYVPTGTKRITFRTEGGIGDLGMYVRFDRTPTLSVYDCRSLNDGNTEECVINNPAEGNWWLGLRGSSAFSGVTLTYTIE